MLKLSAQGNALANPINPFPYLQFTKDLMGQYFQDLMQTAELFPKLAQQFSTNNWSKISFAEHYDALIEQNFTTYDISR